MEYGVRVAIVGVDLVEATDKSSIFGLDSSTIR